MHMGGNFGLTWYVSYVARGDVSGYRVQRATRRFTSEDEARRFARARFEAGDKTLIAGTINPIMPKRIIPSSAIPDWIDLQLPR